ncbi:VOC family protein [Flavobacteriaceae bacterium R38]|nr:VOC family protein [Flavobacteriaceae bacterium R38]
MKLKKEIDHLVYTVFDLDATINMIEQKLGVRPEFGGYHKTQGTKNALLNLGNKCYLELLAIDDTNTEIPPLRWMGIDLLTSDKITRLAVKSDKLEEDSRLLKAINPEMGIINGGSRKTGDGSLLTWELTMPLSTPEVEIIPFMIDWKNEDNHPTKNLPVLCKLVKLYATHPMPESLESILGGLGTEIELIKSKEISIKAIIEGPGGILEL